jgi:hypothetical protein
VKRRGGDSCAICGCGGVINGFGHAMERLVGRWHAKCSKVIGWVAKLLVRSWNCWLGRDIVGRVNEGNEATRRFRRF